MLAIERKHAAELAFSVIVNDYVRENCSFKILLKAKPDSAYIKPVHF